jgi:two-component system chemotaxis sensor kinase CheA
MGEMDDILKEFLVESYEGIDRLDRNLVELERNPGSREILDSIFRTLHTIKGTSGFLGLQKLSSVAHVGESLLSRLRTQELALDRDITDGLLSMIDAVREMLSSVESTMENDGDRDYSALVETLTRLQSSASSDSEAHAAPSTETLPLWFSEESPAEDTRGDARAPGVGDSTIRVDVSLLDNLMNLVGELVLARNELARFTSRIQDPAFAASTQKLNLVTSELQEAAMKSRLEPVSKILISFPRVVREVGNACGKKIRLEMEGEDTELDRSIIEAIKDPLAHVVRNCADHGIELPEVRRERGKPEEGVLRICAYHEGGHVNIEISDDGAGIDLARIREKVVERGIMTLDEVEQLSDRATLDLVFLPGFSTAQKVTRVSGRGVGMDVVRTNIERIGGSVDLHSQLGRGTGLRIKIPLTLAIIPALMVSGDGRRIEKIHDIPVIRLRNRLLPVLDLRHVLADRWRVGLHPDREGRPLNLMVLEIEHRRLGLVVDAIHDSEEIVVKPLGHHLACTVFSGATILGDGRVALILDVLGIAQRGNMLQEERNEAEKEEDPTPDPSTLEQKAVLVFTSLAGTRMAIPLSRVTRLERLRGDLIEPSGGRSVVQYRGRIMPLASVSEVLGEPPTDLSRALEIQVIVVENEHGATGLVVDHILDIVEQSYVLEAKKPRFGIDGRAIIQGKVTDFLSVDQILQAMSVG